LNMESRSTKPPVDAERTAALAANAVADTPIPPAALASLDRAIERLPAAIAQCEAEALATK